MTFMSGLYVVLLLALALGSAKASTRTRVAYGVIVVSVLAGLVAALVWYRPHLITILVSGANAIIFANLFPFAAALATPAAVRLGKTKAQKIRITVLMVGLLAASFSGTY